MASLVFASPLFEVIIDPLLCDRIWCSLMVRPGIRPSASRSAGIKARVSASWKREILPNSGCSKPNADLRNTD